jgi:cytidine deaminase
MSSQKQFPIWVPSSEEIREEKIWIEQQIKEIGENVIRGLVRQAVEVRNNAYAPYSRFFVGAALFSTSGKIYTGCNNENVNYTNTGHAETGAISKAVSEGEAKKNRRFIRAIAVVGGSEAPPSPCGLCRQTILEHADNALCIMATIKGEVKYVTSLQLLIPKPFTPTRLGIE